MTRFYAALCLTALLLNACATAGPIVVTCGLQDIAIVASDYNQIVADYKAKDWADLVREAEKVGWATVDCVGSTAATKDATLAPSVKEFRQLHAVELRAAGVSACLQKPNGEASVAHAALPVNRLRQASSPPAVGRDPGVVSAVPASLVDAPGDSASPAKVTSLRGGPEAGHQAHNLTSQVQFLAPQPFAYAGENVSASLAHCYRACGDNVDALAPPGGCECWRKVGSTWRWVASR